MLRYYQSNSPHTSAHRKKAKTVGYKGDGRPKHTTASCTRGLTPLTCAAAGFDNRENRTAEPESSRS